jgi:Fe-S cluster assembly protein SufD
MTVTEENNVASAAEATVPVASRGERFTGFDVEAFEAKVAGGIGKRLP